MASTAGCDHYDRKCLLKAPCCDKLYVCRLCHDAEENHQMDRFRVTEVKCEECHTMQRAQQTCRQCQVQFGEYYCDICHLFDKDKQQYHCQPCGICRIGPREDYFHCEKCNLCLRVNIRGSHKCVENVSRQNCSVCLEDIHSSRIGASVLPCGHLLHSTCLDDMYKSGGYRCPMCMHTAGNLEVNWKLRDEEIAQSPMPAEYQGATVEIMCNDCQARGTAPFHVLGMKCAGCGSYNTAQDGGLTLQPAAAQRLQGDDGESELDTETEAETDPEPEQQPQTQ